MPVDGKQPPPPGKVKQCAPEGQSLESPLGSHLGAQNQSAVEMPSVMHWPSPQSWFVVHGVHIATEPELPLLPLELPELLLLALPLLPLADVVPLVVFDADVAVLPVVPPPELELVLPPPWLQPSKAIDAASASASFFGAKVGMAGSLPNPRPRRQQLVETRGFL